MTKFSKIQMYCAVAFFAAIMASGTSVADDYPLKMKLQQCEAAFEKMHSGSLTQEEAWKVRRQHKELVREILENLNKRNHQKFQSKDSTIPNEEVLENLMVIGSLLEMMAVENLRITDEWGYRLEE